MKKSIKVAGVMLGLLMLLSGCAFGEEAASRKEQTVQSIKIGVLHTADSIPLYVAQQEGFFEKQGITVELAEFGSASEQSKAMETGAIDGMMTDMIVQCLLKKGGTELRTVTTALGAEVTEGKFLVVAAPNSDVSAPEDLENSRIAIAEATMMEYLVDSYCNELNIDVEKAEKVNVPSLSLRYELLMEGEDIDCAILPDPLGDYAVMNGGVAVIDDTALKNNYSRSVISFTKQLLDEEGAVIEKFLKAYGEAVDSINDSPDSYRELACQVANVPQDMQEVYELPGYTRWSVPDEEEVDRLVSWMLNKGLLETGYSYQEVVDDSFIKGMED